MSHPPDVDHKRPFPSVGAAFGRPPYQVPKPCMGISPAGDPHAFPAGRDIPNSPGRTDKAGWMEKISQIFPFSREKALLFQKNGDIIFRQIVESAPEPWVWGPLYVGAAGALRRRAAFAIDSKETYICGMRN